MPINKGHIYKDACIYCEGTKTHFGSDCFACDSTGSEKTRRQLQKVFNSKSDLPLNYNLKQQ